MADNRTTQTTVGVRQWSANSWPREAIVFTHEQRINRNRVSKRKQTSILAPPMIADDDFFAWCPRCKFRRPQLATGGSPFRARGRTKREREEKREASGEQREKERVSRAKDTRPECVFRLFACFVVGSGTASIQHLRSIMEETDDSHGRID